MSTEWLLAATALAAVLVYALAARAYSRWLGGRRRAHGLHAERQAERLLKRAGYRVDTRSPRIDSHVIVDGVRRTCALHGDLIVSRRGRRFLVEVKSGRLASATRESTRRQLLEYWLNSSTDGLLLVDTRDQTIRTIEFDY